MNYKISERRLQRIIEIIKSYDCSKPLHLFLKEYYRSHPEMGSTDRRITASAVYNYYRTGRALLNLPVEEKIAVSIFLCENVINDFIQYIVNKFNAILIEKINSSTEEKLDIISQQNPDFKIENLFPYKKHLSAELNFDEFIIGILMQPKVWIRIKKNYYSQVEKELKEKNILFDKISDVPNALGFENNVKLTELNAFNKGYFDIQDLSSQKTADYLRAEAGEDWWDCCAGAGGKSLMLKDRFPEIKLLATDVRPSILQNLELRFKKAGIKNYSTKVVDLEKENLDETILFDGIICDVPCSGSGTWGRTPESISCFKEHRIIEYQQKQKTISVKAASHLKPNGKLIYITCSIFKEENEDVVEYILNNTRLKLKEKKLIQGSTMRADSLFVAVLEQ